MPMWCGTDYENEKSRQCSSYFNMLYEVRCAALRCTVLCSAVMCCVLCCAVMCAQWITKDQAHGQQHSDVHPTRFASSTLNRTAAADSLVAVRQDRHRGPHNPVDRPGSLPSLGQGRHRLHWPPCQVGCAAAISLPPMWLPCPLILPSPTQTAPPSSSHNHPIAHSPTHHPAVHCRAASTFAARTACRRRCMPK